MPGISPAQFSINVYNQASDIPSTVWESFRLHPGQSNIMFAHALKALKSSESTTGNMWMSLSSESLDFVLSCTRNPLGDYPIFIYTPRRVESMTQEFVIPRMAALVTRLLQVVKTTRVFSVFAPAMVAGAFTSFWSKLTGIAPIEEPYYDATLSYCTNESLIYDDTITYSSECEPRLGTEEDIPQITMLCKEFAKTSPPFTLRKSAARVEAQLLVANKQVWVHTVDGNQIASIVAVTRDSESVAAITKVFTNPKYRQRGFAQRLTRYVCKQLLLRKDKVVLYVGRDNSAARVYSRVGFVGLDPNAAPVPDIDQWIEIGFDQSKVILGHW